MTYNTEEEKKEAFIEMLRECEVTSTTKVILMERREERACFAE